MAYSKPIVTWNQLWQFQMSSHIKLLRLCRLLTPRTNHRCHFPVAVIRLDNVINRQRGWTNLACTVTNDERCTSHTDHSIQNMKYFLWCDDTYTETNRVCALAIYEREVYKWDTVWRHKEGSAQHSWPPCTNTKKHLFDMKPAQNESSAIFCVIRSRGKGWNGSHRWSVSLHWPGEVCEGHGEGPPSVRQTCVPPLPSGG